MSSLRRLAVIAPLAALALTAVVAAVAPRNPSRFDRLVKFDPSSKLGVLAETPESLPDFDTGKAAWAAFRAGVPGDWRVRLDRRSGTPLLVDGSGVRWFDPRSERPTLDALEAMARSFVSGHEAAILVRAGELVLEPQGSGFVDDDHATLTFRRVVDGVPVEGQGFRLFIVRGNLVSFGADRWGAVGRIPDAVYSMETARQVLWTYMGIGATEPIEWIDAGTKVLIPAPPVDQVDRGYAGPVGHGIRHLLAYRFVLRVPGEPGTWVGKVDATTGEVVTLEDDNKYSSVKGGVLPASNDGSCPTGCEQAGLPMPYANVTIDGNTVTSNDTGVFECSPFGSTATTSLVSPYIRVQDNCGAISESAVCDDDVDLQQGSGTDCTVPAGDSAGNTHSSRSSFFHLNRSMEKGRAWLPSNTWLQSQVVDNVNINSTCNAFWSGSVNFYRSGGGCGNTGEISGVFVHEWGHGMDQNDGGGYDNPSEAYADVVAILYDRVSCVGRGFYLSGTCSGYGDTCLSCTGIRDMDYDARQAHTPATPANFIQPNCGGGSGACGRETHCESYPPSEAIFDLATRDLPAAGFDAATSWQIAETLFMKSRQGSGGNVYNCSLPNSDGCNANGWYNTMRVADDDDGNLSNGTPHAAAIFAAFNRHAIACGGVNDASNKNSTSCPALVAPVLSGVAGSSSAVLSWPAVTNASKYRVLRSDLGCNVTQNPIATVDAPSTGYTDSDIPNGYTFSYRVQALAASPACMSPVSNCVGVAGQPFAGSIKFDRGTYGCSNLITVQVTDGNVGASTLTVNVFSNSEPAPETLILTQVGPGSAKYTGTITTTSAPSTTGDGLLRITHGDTITAQYIDANDGQGGTNLLRTATSLGDCVFPIISQVATSGINDVRATVSWTTDENSSSKVVYGGTKPPTTTVTTAGNVALHSVNLTGLQSCTVYWYQVESQDPAGNVAVDTNGGQYFHFETLGNLGNGLQSCHGGKVSVQKTTVNCNDSLPIRVTDLDLNLSPVAVDTVAVTVTSTTEATPETLVLTETGPNTSQFAANIQVLAGAPIPGDGKIQVTAGDSVTVTYQDADDGTGAPAVSFDSALVDCNAPTATIVNVTQITDESARVEWTTNEPNTGKIEWGTSPALGNTINATNLSSFHFADLRPIGECARIHFRITATDAYGNTRILDNNGTPFAFNVNQIPPGVFKDNFEGAAAWTLQGEWQIAAPQGKGTSPADPTTAFEGTKILGHDLSGLGANLGNYEPGVTQSATSPVINASTLTNAQIRLRRWLNVSGNAISSIEVKRNGQLFPVFTTSSASESQWTLQTINVSSLVDGVSSVQIVIKQAGGSSSQSGWNVDRVILNSANSPSFDACGSCGGAPTFSGATGAYDPNPCADTGTTVTWSAAPAWGTGHAGSYSVYRDTTPGFTPSAANRIATGVSGTSYNDATAPNGATLYYLVRAENDETCSTGPKNGGVTDANAVYVSAVDQTSQILPGAVGNILANPVNDAHVRLSWGAVANAARYRIYRSLTPNGALTQIGDVAGTAFDDLGQMGSTSNAHYVVKAADSCGNVGP